MHLPPEGWEARIRGHRAGFPTLTGALVETADLAFPWSSDTVICGGAENSNSQCPLAGAPMRRVRDRSESAGAGKASPLLYSDPLP